MDNIQKSDYQSFLSDIKKKYTNRSLGQCELLTRN